MSYRQHKPHPVLDAYIDAYWTASNNGSDLAPEKVLPDGCVDIILNLGDDFKTDESGFVMQHEKTYLVGTMTSYQEISLSPKANLLGIRFKPAAFAAFFSFNSLHEVTDLAIEFEKKLAPDLHQLALHSISYLDHFFIKRLAVPKHILFPVIADIKNNNGQMNVTTLAQRNCTTVRQLERSFKQHVGISPKAFINLVRYQSVLPYIQKNYKRSLTDIALEYGYYDHAHLSKEVKRYTGIAPSQL